MEARVERRKRGAGERIWDWLIFDEPVLVAIAIDFERTEEVVCDRLIVHARCAPTGPLRPVEVFLCYEDAEGSTWALTQPSALSILRQVAPTLWTGMGWVD